MWWRMGTSSSPWIAGARGKAPKGKVRGNGGGDFKVVEEVVVIGLGGLRGGTVRIRGKAKF